MFPYRQLKSNAYSLASTQGRGGILKLQHFLLTFYPCQHGFYPILDILMFRCQLFTKHLCKQQSIINRSCAIVVIEINSQQLCLIHNFSDLENPRLKLFLAIQLVVPEVVIPAVEHDKRMIGGDSHI
jgi:hypothetical protein